MELFIKVYIFIFGLVIGSFLNVVIYRVPQKLSISKGHSFCPDCRHKLNWIDLFPVFSYLFLLGKCRYCKCRISPRYPLIELANALCYFLIYIQYGIQLISLLYAISCSCLIVVALIDWDNGIVLDRFNIIIGICGLILAVFSGDISWVERVIGLFAISVPLLIVAVLTNGIGEGDIKLFAALGLLLGWKLSLLTMLFASVFASIFGLTLVVLKKGSGKSQIPFGPFISFGAITAALFGNPMIAAYLSLFSL